MAGKKCVNSIHGMSQTNTYHVWEAMISRCVNTNNPRWGSYGGRGITVCDEWKTFIGFLNDMGEKPNSLSLDRIDNNKGYNKENCRWASQEEQMRNTSVTSRIDAGITKIGVNKNLFRVRLSVKNKPIHIGVFETFEDAIFARKIAEMIYWGEK